MKNSLMKVSVVVPAYNEEDYIEKCINSLKRQEYPKEDYEIIVIDNNSTDHTISIIKTLGIKFTKERIKGPAAAKNAGIKMTKGDIVAFIDGDCIAKEDWLAKIMAAFKSPNIGCVAGEIIGSENQNLSELEKFLIKKGHLSQVQHVNHSFMPFAATANAAYRKEVFDHIGLFDQKLLIGEDTDMSWRMQLHSKYKLAYVPEATVFHPYESKMNDLFRQKRRHAYGSTLVYKKYRQYLKKEDNKIKHTYWEYSSLIKRWRKYLYSNLKKTFYRNNTAVDPLDQYQLILETAWKVGLIQGSIRHRVWHL